MQAEEQSPLVGPPGKARPRLPRWYLSTLLVSFLLLIGSTAATSMLVYRSQVAGGQGEGPNAAKAQSTTIGAARSGICQWNPDQARVTCARCECPGVALIKGHCGLAPGSRWRLSPVGLRWRRAKGAPDTLNLEVCLRSAPASPWLCSRPISTKVSTDGSDALSYQRGSSCIEVTEHELLEVGIDVEVRLGDRPVWRGTSMRHDVAVVAGPSLFYSGLLLPASTARSREDIDRGLGQFKSVLVGLQPVESP